MSKDILIVFLDIVPFSEHSILFLQKQKELISGKRKHFEEVFLRCFLAKILIAVAIFVVTQGDPSKL